MTLLSFIKKSFLCSLVLSCSIAMPPVHAGFNDWFSSASEFISNPDNNGFVVGSLLCIGAALAGTYYYFFQKPITPQPKPKENDPPKTPVIEEKEVSKKSIAYTQSDINKLSIQEIIALVNSQSAEEQNKHLEDDEFPKINREKCLESEIINSQERTLRNAQHLNNTEHRILNIPVNCQGMSEHLIIGRALRQPDGWSCGPHCLFTAQLISQWLNDGNDAKKFNDTQQFINYDTYKANVFQSWYMSNIVDKDAFGHVDLSKHEISKLPCPVHLYDESQQQNYLQSPKIFSIANTIGLKDQFFLLSAPFVADPKTPLELHIENDGIAGELYWRKDSSNYITESSNYLRAVVNAFQNGAYSDLQSYNLPKVDYHMMPALYFFCNINNHWVLIVAAKCNNDIKLILLDPKNELDTQEQLTYENNLNDTTTRLLNCLYQIIMTPFK